MTFDSRLPTPASVRPCRRLPFYDGDAAGMLAGAEALLEGVAASETPAIRWYVVAAPALILGASQRPPAVDLDACRAAGVAVYQRAAGGATVLVDADMLGLDVALPRDDPLLARDLTASYAWIGAAWHAALRALGADARLMGVEEARASGREEGTAARLARLACFGGLSPYEVAVGGRKVVGLAQVRRRQGALFQTAVQLRFDAPRLGALLTVADEDRAALAAALRERVIGLDEALGYVPVCDNVMAAVERVLLAHGLAPADAAWTVAESATAARLLDGRYRPLM